MNNDRLEKMNKYRRFFYTEFNIDLDRVGNTLYPLKSESGITIESFGDESRIYKIDSGKHISISTYHPDFFDLQVLFDQYRNKSKKLLSVNLDSYPRKGWYRETKNFEEAVAILLNPLETYQDFVGRINEIREVFKEVVINQESITGKIEDWFYGDFQTRNDCESIKKISETEWQVLFWERGTAKVEITMFDKKHVYEYIINKYLHLI